MRACRLVDAFGSSKQAETARARRASRSGRLIRTMSFANPITLKMPSSRVKNAKHLVLDCGSGAGRERSSSTSVVALLLTFGAGAAVASIFGERRK